MEADLQKWINMSPEREKYWRYSKEEIDARMYCIGDEYLKDGQWHVIKT